MWKKYVRVVMLSVLSVAIVAGALFALTRSRSGSSTTVVVVLDTVGFGAVFDKDLGVEAPFLRTLADSSAFFSQAFSVAPWTKPSIASILTGVYPAQHGVRHPRSNISQGVPTMAELFSRAGYKTAGVVSHVFLAPKTSYRRGFDSYEMTDFTGHVHDSITASQVTTKGLQWLESTKREARGNKLLFLHYFDPHFNYKHRPEFNRTSWYKGSLTDEISFGELKARKDSLSEEDVRYIKGLYQEEILATDAELKRLYDGVRTVVGDDDFTFIVTADHGEAFRDHNHLGHGHFLYNELVRVPLLFHNPKNIAPKRIDSVVSTMDILPTLLELEGITSESTIMQGKSFLSLMSSEAKSTVKSRLPIFEVKYHADRFGTVYWPWKAILNTAEGRWEYFNLEMDPGELNPIQSTEVDLLVRAKCEQAVGEYIREDISSQKKQGSDEITYSQKELETLKTLGYAM